MRRIEALLAAGLVWAIAGCGASVIGPGSHGAGSGLVLADASDGGRFLLSVAGGAPELAEMSGTAAGGTASDPELIDSVTGAAYSLAVDHGALTLTPAAAGVGAVAQVGFVDAVTGKAYSLAVVRGGLTLIPG